MQPLVNLTTNDTDKVLLDRVLDGQLFVVRKSLQQWSLYDLAVERTLKGIRRTVGDDAAAFVAENGFERIHEVVTLDQLAEMTDAVYRQFADIAQEFLERYVPGVFGIHDPFYYERPPNVRFHYPFDLTLAHRKQLADFAKSHGQGKLSAHAPHRDHWLDCPENAVNCWIALGPVKEGNGLSIFNDNYAKELEYEEDGNLKSGTPLSPPTNFALEPGDAVIFHASHVHASELNSTDQTRYVVSFRLTFGKPRFPEGHHHEYVHSGLAGAGGVKRLLASVPAYLQKSYAVDRAHRVARKLSGGPSALTTRNVGPGGGKGAAANAEVRDEKLATKGEVSFPLDEIPVGEVRAIASDACVARLAENKFAAFSRHCLHQGADLSCGFLRAEKLHCPWHNLTFDLETGASPCQELRALSIFSCEVRDNRVVVTAAGIEEGRKQKRG